MEEDKEIKCRIVPLTLTNLDKQILVKCFRKDGKIRAPTKSKLYHLLSGNKDQLTYSEIRYILKYIDDEYKYNAESKLKEGLWNRDMINLFNMPTKLCKLTATSFNKALSVYKEKRTPGQKKTQEMLEKLLKVKEEEEENRYKLPYEELNDNEVINSNNNISDSPIYKSNYLDLCDLDNLTTNSSYNSSTGDSPKSIIEQTSISTQCNLI